MEMLTSKKLALSYKEYLYNCIFRVHSARNYISVCCIICCYLLLLCDLLNAD